MLSGGLLSSLSPKRCAVCVLYAVCLSVLLSVHCIALYLILCNFFNSILFNTVDIFIGCHYLVFTIWVWYHACMHACMPALYLFTFLKYIMSHLLDDFSSLCCVQCAVCVALLRMHLTLQHTSLHSTSLLVYSLISNTIAAFLVSFARQAV